MQLESGAEATSHNIASYVQRTRAGRRRYLGQRMGVGWVQNVLRVKGAALAAALVALNVHSCGAGVDSPPGSPLKTTQLVMSLPRLPRRPLLMQLNTRVLMTELSEALGRSATLDDIQDSSLDGLAQAGYHIIYLLGVWKTGRFGLNKSRKLLAQDPCMQGFTEDTVGSSPFAITDYTVADELGGDPALERLCARIRSRRMRAVVDFVPNHGVF